MEGNVTENTANFEVIRNETTVLEQATDQIPCMATEPPSITEVVHDISSTPCIFFLCRSF